MTNKNNLWTIKNMNGFRYITKCMGSVKDHTIK